MDSDQIVSLQSLQMNSMWEATTICTAANVPETPIGIFNTNPVPVEDIIVNCIVPCWTFEEIYIPSSTCVLSYKHPIHWRFKLGKKF